MGQGDVIQIAQQAIYTALMLAAPMLSFGLIVGILISIFQAATQINEQTLVFIPKILAVAVALILFGPWMINTMVEFTTQLFVSINMIVR